MENGKSKYEEKLSAYLDGELTPEEMAEVAAELSSNPALGAKLDRLRELDSLSDDTLSDFDDEVLGRLERNIMDNLDNDRTAAPEMESGESIDSQKKIVPLWQRFVTIAASIAVLFLVGKMAFEETGDKSLMAPSIRTDQLMPPPALTEETTGQGGASDADDAGMSGEDVQEETIGAAKRQASAVTPDEVRESISDATAIQAPAPPAQPPQIAMDEEADVTREKRERANERLSLDIPLPSADEVREKKTADARDEAEGIQEKSRPEPLPLEDYGDQMHFNVVDNIKPVDIKAEKDAEVNAAEEMAATGSSFLEKESATEMAKILPKQDSLQIKLLPLDSLKDIFAMYVPPVAKDDKVYLKQKTTASAGIVGETRSKMEMLLDSLAQLPGIDNDADEIESLYLKARTHYELYLATKDIQHYREAIQARDALNSLVTSELNSHPGNARIREYATDIASWRFDR